MNIVAALLGEHGPLRHQLDVLRLAAPRLSGDALRSAVLSLAEAIESHAELEDELLFAALDESGQMPAGPVGGMRAEHDQIVELLGRLLASDDTPDRGDPRRVVLELAEAVRHHFAHEENVLFALANRVLAADKLDDLGRQWADRRRVVTAALDQATPATAMAR